MRDISLIPHAVIPVVEELNRRGWRTKHWTSRTGRRHPGQPFSKQALLSILKNVTYIGQVRYKGTIYPGEQPRIVDENLFREVNHELASQRVPQPKLAGKAALLKGLLWCEACQSFMILSQVRRQGSLYRYYVCCECAKARLARVSESVHPGEGDRGIGSGAGTQQLQTG